MSQLAELHLLKTRIDEIEDVVKDLDRGRERSIEKLRDKFAGLAMVGYMGAHYDMDIQDRAAAAYEMADAMLAVRERGGK